LSTTEKPYRDNVGVVVFNREGKVLAGERSDRPGHFQLPQGGIDPGEEPVEAARRELYEETGLALDEEPVHEVDDWLVYDFPAELAIERDIAKRYRGQRQKWFFFYWDGDPANLSVDHHEPEFEHLFWIDLPDLTVNMVAFKRAIYERLCAEADRVVAGYVDRI